MLKVFYLEQNPEELAQVENSVARLPNVSLISAPSCSAAAIICEQINFDLYLIADSDDSAQPALLELIGQTDGQLVMLTAPGQDRSDLGFKTLVKPITVFQLSAICQSLDAAQNASAKVIQFRR